MFIDIFERDEVADSFKTWDNCMHKNPCKPITIALLVVASLLVLCILGAFVRCCFCGVSCMESFCCCCGRKNRKQQQVQQAPNEKIDLYDDSSLYQPNQMNYANNNQKMTV